MRPRSFGGELEAPRGGHRQARDFGHHGAQAAVPQPLFKAGEDGLLVAALEIDDAVGFQAGLRERRGEKVRAGDAPEHFAARARGDPGGEERGGGAVDGAVAPAGDLMQRAAREPAAGSRESTAARPKGSTVGRAGAGLRFAGPGRAKTQGRTGAAQRRCPPGAR